jgi:hypothetical protein
MTNPSFDSTDLPALQARTQCVLIARDPNFIYAYWDYTHEAVDQMRHHFKFEGAGDPQLVLRVYDITLVKFNGANANHSWDLEVGFSAKNWYIPVWQDNADYCAELGFRCGGNHFMPLVRSNIVRTPPKTASSRNDLIWQDIKARHESQPYLKEDIKQRYQRLMQQHVKKQLLQVKQPRKARIYKLTAQDIRDYYMELFSRVSRKSRKKAKTFSIKDILKGMPSGISWQKVRPVVIFPDLIRRTHQGASMEFSEKSGGSESVSSFQSGASEGRLNKRKFFFEIWTELIVHGRTEPDASVWLDQKGIKLNPDGTFTLYYALPDCEIPFKFIAQSSDGIEQRHIQTRVEREKTVFFTKMLKDTNG